MSVPDQITMQAFDQAMTFLGFERPDTIVELRFDGSTLAVVSVVPGILRGGQPVYEQSTYMLGQQD